VRILRVFQERTPLTPNDNFVRIGQPTLFDPIPDIDEVHVSCVFIWNRKACEGFVVAYQNVYDVPVRIGGPGLLTNAEDFIPGRYISKDVVFFTRGCPGNCRFCIVPKIEGRKIRELEPRGEGNIVQDNNIFAASRSHFEKVIAFLRGRRNIQFKGGLDAARLKDYHIEGFRSLNIKELWFACDSDSRLKIAEKAIRKVRKAGFTRHQVRAYCLIGFEGTIEENRERCQRIVDAGADTFAMLYQPIEGKPIVHSREWKNLQRHYSRPALYRTKKGK